MRYSRIRYIIINYDQHLKKFSAQIDVRTPDPLNLESGALPTKFLIDSLAVPTEPNTTLALTKSTPPKVKSWTHLWSRLH